MDAGSSKVELSLVRAIFVVVGGICVHLCLGSFYIFGNISPYMISYLRNRTDEHSLRNVDNLWIMNAASLVLPFGMTLGGVIDRHLGVRAATAIGCTIFCTGVGLTYFTIQRSLVFVALTYGSMTNLGSTIAYGPPAQTAVKWLPRRPTFAVGLIVCGFGGGALIFNQVVTAFVNPSNVSPDLETPDGQKYFTNTDLLDRVPYMFLLLAGIYVVMQCVGIILIAPPPTDKQKAACCDKRHINEVTEDYDDNVLQEDNPLLSDVPHAGKRKKAVSVGTVLLIMLKNKNSYIWWAILFLIYGGMQFANSLYKAYGQTFISDDYFLALIGSLSSIFNCLLRPVWGIIMDKYGFQVAVKMVAASFVCLSCTLMLTETMGRVAYLIWICGMYGASCGVWAIGPATMARLFGVENMAINYGFIFSAVSCGTIASGFIGLNLESALGWHGLFLLAGGMATLAFFISFAFDGKDTEGNPI